MEAAEDPEGPQPATGFAASVRARAAAWQQRGSEWLTGHEHVAPVDVAVRLYQRDRESAGTMLGSAIAFRLFFFFVPFLLFFVGLAGFLSGWVDADDVDDQVGLSGSLSSQVHAAFEQNHGTRWIAIATGLFGMIKTGRTLSRVLSAASAIAWRLPVTRKTSMKLVGAIAGLVTSVGLVSVIVNRIRGEWGVGASSVSFLGALAFYFVAWFALFLLLPRATNDPSVLLPGAALVALTLAVMQLISHVYLPNRLSHASELYGAIGTTIVTLGWFFFLGRAIVVANELNAAVYERLGSLSEFVFALPVFRSIARRSPWIRRFFDLENPAEPGGS
ncbi:MAG: YhjD/YihY/BrkB family envelope integrity protein [Acidimicrobiia bacterium]